MRRSFAALSEARESNAQQRKQLDDFRRALRLLDR
jgi:hypothetical protein